MCDADVYITRTAPTGALLMSPQGLDRVACATMRGDYIPQEEWKIGSLHMNTHHVLRDREESPIEKVESKDARIAREQAYQYGVEIFTPDISAGQTVYPASGSIKSPKQVSHCAPFAPKHSIQSPNLTIQKQNGYHSPSQLPPSQIKSPSVCSFEEAKEGPLGCAPKMIDTHISAKTMASVGLSPTETHSSNSSPVLVGSIQHEAAGGAAFRQGLYSYLGAQTMLQEPHTTGGDQAVSPCGQKGVESAARDNSTKILRDERRQKFLERNRLAAYRCRQKKKLWVQDLEKKLEDVSNDNAKLQHMVSRLNKELVELKYKNQHCRCKVSCSGGDSEVPSQESVPVCAPYQYSYDQEGSGNADSRLQPSSYTVNCMLSARQRGCFFYA